MVRKHETIVNKGLIASVKRMPAAESCSAARLVWGTLEVPDACRACLRSYSESLVEAFVSPHVDKIVQSSGLRVPASASGESSIRLSIRSLHASSTTGMASGGLCIQSHLIYRAYRLLSKGRHKRGGQVDLGLHAYDKIPVSGGHLPLASARLLVCDLCSRSSYGHIATT